tara:strand:+ start:324 stop:539 length:216 start_codon:yes stop_codon:yes gene_type:complete
MIDNQDLSDRTSERITQDVLTNLSGNLEGIKLYDLWGKRSGDYTGIALMNCVSSLVKDNKVICVGGVYRLE